MRTTKARLATLLLATLVIAWGPAAPARAQEYVIGARDVLKVTVWLQLSVAVALPVLAGAVESPQASTLSAPGRRLMPAAT